MNGLAASFSRMKSGFAGMTILLILLQFTACSEKECVYCQNEKQGTVLTNLTLSTDSTIRYTLFVPAGTDDDKLPLLVFFDAHGNTTPVLEKYKELAVRYNIIMAGFDASANEVPFEKTQNAFRPWLKELASVAPIDTAWLFLAGFSGGARVVSMLENMMTEVDATALCGAGPSNPEAWLRSTRPCMAFAGTSDFNYLELLNLQMSVREKKQLPLSLFSGKHEWAPASAFEDFFFLMSRLTSGDNGMLTDESAFINRCQTILSNGRADLALSSASSAMYAIGIETSPLLKEFSDSLKQNISKEFIDEYNANLNQEVVLQNKIRNLFSLADTFKYHQFIDSLQSHCPHDSLTIGYDVNQRLKAFCGIIAYSFVGQARNSKSSNLFSLLRMYQMTEPNNNEMLLLFSAYYAQQGDCEKAKIFMDKAKKMGFSDKKRYESMKEFGSCRSIIGF